MKHFIIITFYIYIYFLFLFLFLYQQFITRLAVEDRGSYFRNYIQGEQTNMKLKKGKRKRKDKSKKEKQNEVKEKLIR